MKRNNEKGAISLDYVTAMVIFAVGCVAVLSLYLGIYKTMAKIKIDEAIIGYITEVCETIDLYNYEDVDSKEEINEIIVNAKIPNQYSVTCDNIIKYSNDGKYDQDIVEKVVLNVSYQIDQINRNFSINKMKVKE